VIVVILENEVGVCLSWSKKEIR